MTFDCSPFLGARRYARNATGGGAHAVPIAWEAALPGTGSGNPFENSVGPGFNSTCQFPQITAGGLEDSWQHGRVRCEDGESRWVWLMRSRQDLAAVYQDKLEFVSSTLNDSEVTFRVTNNEITSQVLGALVVGLFPNVTEHTAVVEVSRFFVHARTGPERYAYRARAMTLWSQSTPAPSQISFGPITREAMPTGRST